jgi:hypothetical protein
MLKPVLDIIAPVPDNGVPVAQKLPVLLAAAKLAVQSVMAGNFKGQKFPHGFTSKLAQDLNISRPTCDVI